MSWAPAAVCLSILAGTAAAQTTTNVYPWLTATNKTGTVATRFAPPSGFERIPVDAGSFADWLRHLPLKEEGAPVLLHNGTRKQNQDAHVAVIRIDTGDRDLQQCADAIIRLRAEHLYSRRLFAAIRFNFTSGDPAPFLKWAEGYRPVTAGRTVRWEKTAPQDSSYSSFRKYLDAVFLYAGTLSLSRELEARTGLDAMQIGDVFIRGGSPGHAVIVVDMAESKPAKKKVFLLAQSYMPAQEIHVLKNPNAPALSPWYDPDLGETLHTPEWDFQKTELKGFRVQQSGWDNAP